MRTMLAVTIILIVFRPAAVFSADTVAINDGKWVGCFDRDDYDRIGDFFIDKDFEAAALMLASGRCKVLESGTKVFVEDLSFWGGTVAVRERGSTTSLWTAYEAVQQPRPESTPPPASPSKQPSRTVEKQAPIPPPAAKSDKPASSGHHLPAPDGDVDAIWR